MAIIYVFKLKVILMPNRISHMKTICWLIYGLISCIGIAPVAWGLCGEGSSYSSTICSNVKLDNRNGKATWWLSNKMAKVPGGGSGGPISANGMVTIPKEGYVFSYTYPSNVHLRYPSSHVPATIKAGEVKSFEWCATRTGPRAKDPELIIEYQSNYGQIIVLDYALHLDGCNLSNVSSLPSDTAGYITHSLYHYYIYSPFYPGTAKESVNTIFGTPPTVPKEIKWTFKMKAPNMAPAIAPILQEKINR